MQVPHSCPSPPTAGYVGEVYGQGLQLVWSLLGNALGIVVSAMFLMPVMYPLRLSSVNEVSR